MANGGIIGPVNTVNAAQCLPAKTTSFTSSGTFTAQATATADYLVVAGGGGGGSSVNGGGGAGGYRSSVGPSPLQGSAIPVVAGVAVDVTIGGGGAGGGPGTPSGNHGGSSGTNSIFAGSTPITATGGGGGGSRNTPGRNSIWWTTRRIRWWCWSKLILVHNLKDLEQVYVVKVFQSLKEVMEVPGRSVPAAFRRRWRRWWFKLLGGNIF